MFDTSQEEGQILSFAQPTWVKIAISESRLQLLEKMVTLNYGFNEVEDYNLSLNMKLKSEALKNKGDRSVIREIMSLKLRDEKKVNGELICQRNKSRREISECLGENSRRARKIFKIMRNEAAKVKADYKEKYDKKLKKIGVKKHIEEEAKLEKVPEKLEAFKFAKIFKKSKFEEIEVQNYEITVVGEIDFSEEEKQVLRLHPKFALLQNLDMEEMEWDLELGFAKLRYQLSKEEGEKLGNDGIEGEEEEINEEEAEKLEEVEARARQIYSMS